MSHARKHVKQSAGAPPDLDLLEIVARVTDIRGSQLEVDTGKERILVLVPSKFKRMVFIKKGGFVVVRHNPDITDARFKVRGTLSTVLAPDQIKDLKREGKWPECFDSAVPVSAPPPTPEQPTTNVAIVPVANSKSVVQEDLLVANPNRRIIDLSEDEDEDSSEEENST